MELEECIRGINGNGKNTIKKLFKNVAEEENPLHLGTQVWLPWWRGLSLPVGALQWHGRPSPPPPTLPPAVTHVGDRLNTESERRAALMLQP